MTNVVAFACGALFAVGLGIGSMTQPTRVLAFLDVAGDWEPRLGFVMLGAIAAYAPVYWLAIRRARPMMGAAFHLPAKGDVDRRLVMGAALFGVGWGLAGLCPAPAITSLASGEPAALLFDAAMLAGMAGARLLTRRDARIGIARRAGARSKQAGQ